MARKPRLDPTNGFHHVWNRGVNRNAVFFSDSDRVEFGRQLDRVHREFGVATLSYCLLDNHYHLLVHCPDGGLSAAMQQLGTGYTRHVNDRVGRDGPLFRGRFGSRLVDNHEYLVGVTRYIHRNALDVRGVATVDQYRWSSHRCYVGARATPPWLDTTTVLAHFAGDGDAFHRFVSRDDSPDVRAVTPPVLAA